MDPKYAQMLEHIAKLQAEAEAFRLSQVAAVIARIREDIKTHGLTAQDLFGKAAGKATKGKVKTPAVPKYTDGAGNFWVGRGKRPKWLSDALAAGKKLEDYLFGSPAEAPAPAVKKAAAKAATKKVPAKKVAARKKAV